MLNLPLLPSLPVSALRIRLTATSAAPAAGEQADTTVSGMKSSVIALAHEFYHQLNALRSACDALSHQSSDFKQYVRHCDALLSKHDLCSVVQQSCEGAPSAVRDAIGEAREDGYFTVISEAQSTTDLCLDPASFRDLVKEIGRNYKRDLRWDSEAVAALQVASEQFVTELMEGSMSLALHADNTYICFRDLRLYRSIQPCGQATQSF